MKNVATRVEGNMLWIGVDLTQDNGRTKSNKGTTVAATEGYRNLPGDNRYGFTLHLYKRDDKAAS